MKICLVLISGGWGGAENMVYHLAKKLEGNTSVIMIINNELVRYFSNLQRVKIFKIGSLYDFRSLIALILLKGTNSERKFKWNFGLFYYLNKLLRYLYYKRISKEIVQILTQQNVDIVHLHLENSLKLFLTLFKELNLPVVFTVHGVRDFGKFKPVESIMIKKGLTKVDKVTCVSKYSAKVLENSSISISNKLVTIYNGVDLAEITRYSAPKIPLKGEFKLLFPGGAKLFKGGDLLIKSLPQIKKEVPNVHLYIAGAVPERHTLRKLVEERKLGQDVTFMGFLPPQRYYRVLSSTDLLVFPSENEAFGIVLLEAMALGKPVVASRVGGIPEVVKNMQNGILTNRDPKSIADAVVCLSKDKDLYEQISQANLKSVRSFDWNNIVNEYIELYKTLID
jgi:glycosyltransferase involved in cell wall biosynthesis